MGALTPDCLGAREGIGMRKKHNKIGGQFAPRTIEMLRSPAMRVLSLSGRRFLDRLEIELASHGGRDNGRLPVTFANLAEFGIDRHAIGPGQREVCALGLVELTRPGQAGGGEFRTPNLFRLTYLPAYGKGPTHEWRKIETVEEAEQIARKVRRTIKNRVRKKHFPSGGKPTRNGGESPPDTSGGKPTVAPDSPVGENPPLSRQGLAISTAGQRGRERQPPHRQAAGAATRIGRGITFHRTNNRGGRNGKGE
jgi:hypothetical protein